MNMHLACVRSALTVMAAVQSARRRWGDGTSPTVLRGVDALGYAHLSGAEYLLLGNHEVRTMTARAVSYDPKRLNDVAVVTFLPRGVLPVAVPRAPLRTRAKTAVSPTTFARATLTLDEVDAARRLAWEVNILRHHRMSVDHE